MEDILPDRRRSSQTADLRTASLPYSFSMNALHAAPSGMEFTEDEIARLLRQFDVTRLEDPMGAEAYCRALEVWLAGQSRGASDLDRMAADLWFMQGMLGQAVSYTHLTLPTILRG